MKQIILLFILLLSYTSGFAQPPCSYHQTWVNRPVNNDKQAKVTIQCLRMVKSQRTSFTIDFGDGSAPQTLTTIDTIHSFYHTYASFGQYNLTMSTTATDTISQAVLCSSTFTDSARVRQDPCNFNFEYTYDPVVKNRLHFNITSLPTGKYMSYIWQMGDGTTLNGPSVSYTYSNDDSLTFILGTHNGECGMSAPTDILTYKRINGLVHFDSTYLYNSTRIKIWLAKHNATNNSYDIIDSTEINPGSLPYNKPYEFRHIPAGDYLVKAGLIKGINEAAGSVPTYHPSQLYWNNAQLLNFNGMPMQADINMQPGINSGGNGFISGRILETNSTAVGSIGVLLLDKNGDPAGAAVTDASGRYSMTDIADGSYTIHADAPGYTTTVSSVEISSSQPAHNGISFELSPVAQTIMPKPTNITDIESEAKGYNIHPNPAKDIVYISWHEQSNNAATISITDINSKVIYSKKALMNNEISIDLRSVTAGLYYLNIATEAGTTTQKLVIE